MDQLGQKFNLFVTSSNGYSFSSILVQKVLKSDIVFLRYGNLIDDVIQIIDIEKKDFTVWESGQCISVQQQFKSPILHEDAVFTSNPQAI